MNAKSLFQSKLLWIAGGSMLGMIAGATVNKNMAVPYSKEITGAGLTVAGSMMMVNGSKNVKRIGTGVGSAGVSLLGSSVYSRVTSNGQSNNNNDQVTGGSGFSIPNAQMA